MQHNAMQRIDEILSQEKIALLAGQYDALASLADQKGRALIALGSSKPSKKIVTDVQSRIQENQALLAAAIRGIRAAQGRIEDLKKVQNSLTVYDHSGNMEVVTTRTGAIEKKA